MRTVYQLKPKEIAKVEKAIKQDKRPEVRQRATVIRLLHLGAQTRNCGRATNGECSNDL